jgi:hypothetical protein
MGFVEVEVTELPGVGVLVVEELLLLDRCCVRALPRDMAVLLLLSALLGIVPCA